MSGIVLEGFAGPGGWSTGLRMAGYTGTATGIEHDTAACRTAVVVRLGARTAKLLREAIVLAHVEGMRYGRATGPDDPYPMDSDVVSLVLAASVSFRDLYPTLSRLDEAKAADAERRQRSLERIKHLMAKGER